MTERERALDELLARADPAAAAASAEAVRAAQDACRLADELGRTHDALQARAWLARHCFHLGRQVEALHEASRLRNALPADEAGALRVDVLRLQALAACELGDFDVALDAAEALMHLRATLDDGEVALNAATALGACFDRMGHSWQAERILSEAIDAHGASGPVGPRLTAANALAAVCGTMAHLLRHRPDDDERRRILARGWAAAEQGMALLATRPNAVFEAVLQTNGGDLLLEQGEAAAAFAMLSASVEVARRHDMARLVAQGETLRALALLAMGRPQQALTLIGTVLTHAATDTMPQLIGRAHDAAYRIHRALGEWQPALEHYERAEAIERDLLLETLRRQSSMLVSRSEAEQARLRAERARKEALEQRGRAAALERDAHTDTLTGLGNRRHLDAAIAPLMQELQRNGGELVVAQVDADHFKRVNDGHGHAAGDAVLVRLAQLMKDHTRGGDIVVRHGGEEFVLVFPATSMVVAKDVCERLRGMVERSEIALPSGSRLQVTVSIGLASAPPYDLPLLLQRADEALYRAKQHGRNRVEAG